MKVIKTIILISIRESKLMLMLIAVLMLRI